MTLKLFPCFETTRRSSNCYCEPVRVGIDWAHGPLFSHRRKLSIRCIQLVEKINWEWEIHCLFFAFRRNISEKSCVNPIWCRHSRPGRVRPPCEAPIIVRCCTEAKAWSGGSKVTTNLSFRFQRSHCIVSYLQSKRKRRRPLSINTSVELDLISSFVDTIILLLDEHQRIIHDDMNTSSLPFSAPMPWPPPSTLAHLEIRNRTSSLRKLQLPRQKVPNQAPVTSATREDKDEDMRVRIWSPVPNEQLLRK